jgi:hypothetical protein
MASRAALLAWLRESDRPEEHAEVCRQIHLEQSALDGGDAVAAVVLSMQRWPSHVVLQASACAALVQLVTDNADNLGKAGGAGAIEAVTAAMRSHAADAKVQQWCCYALYSLTRRNAAHQAKADAAGALEALLSVLSAHTAVACVMEEGYAALSTLVHDREEAVPNAVALNAFETVVAGMYAHPADTRVQSAACSLLGNLCVSLGSSSHAERPFAAGAVDAVLAAVRTHVADDGVQYAGCFALGNMFGGWRRHATQHKALAGEAVLAAVAALRAHPTIDGVQLEACHALVALVTGADERALAGAGAVRAVLAALRAWPEHADLHSRGAGALQNLCEEHAEHARIAVADGALDTVVASLRAHVGHALVASRCTSVLFILFQLHAGVHAAPGATRAVEAVVAALLAHPADVDVQVEGLVMLGLRAPSAAHMRTAVAAGAADAVHAALGADVSAGRQQALLMACYTALYPMLRHEGQRIIQAGVLEAMLDVEARECNISRENKREAETLLPLLRAAAQRHDAKSCKHVECRRCAAVLRTRCAMCALPACHLRRREDRKTLLQCPCRLAAYCGAAHQREDRARHCDACRAQLAEREAGGAAE